MGHIRLGDRINHPSAWRVADLAQAKDWIHMLGEAEIDELADAVATVKSLGLKIVDIGRDDFDLPLLGPVLAKVKDNLINGRGVALVRGVPVSRLSREDAAITYWGIGVHIGEAVSQNSMGHVLGHVKDVGDKADDVNTRGYRSRDDLPFHNDIGAEVIGLLCLHESKSGGLSSVASAAAIHNEMLKRNPEYVAALAEPLYRDRRGETPEGEDPYYPMPVFNYHAGHFTVCYVRRFIESAQRFKEVPRLSAPQIDAMAMMMDLAYSDELRLDISFQPGDIQFVNNLTMLHTRTEFEDYPEPERKRHLLRLWLAEPDGWPLPDAFYARYGATAESGRPAGIAAPTRTAPLEAE
ncbi:MAG: TauD/TfdA family dioxygenase [Alphaproteobacteria bacterium]|nr:TauD/TfdA family dioxygenase [Alphaproteobacteria bacterium]